MKIFAFFAVFIALSAAVAINTQESQAKPDIISGLHKGIHYEIAKYLTGIDVMSLGATNREMRQFLDDSYALSLEHTKSLLVESPSYIVALRLAADRCWLDETKNLFSEHLQLRIWQELTQSDYTDLKTRAVIAGCLPLLRFYESKSGTSAQDSDGWIAHNFGHAEIAKYLDYQAVEALHESDSDPFLPKYCNGNTFPLLRYDHLSSTNAYGCFKYGVLKKLVHDYNAQAVLKSAVRGKHFELFIVMLGAFKKPNINWQSILNEAFVADSLDFVKLSCAHLEPADVSGFKCSRSRIVKKDALGLFKELPELYPNRRDDVISMDSLKLAIDFNAVKVAAFIYASEKSSVPRGYEQRLVELFAKADDVISFQTALEQFSGSSYYFFWSQINKDKALYAAAKNGSLKVVKFLVGSKIVGLRAQCKAMMLARDGKEFSVSDFLKQRNDCSAYAKVPAGAALSINMRRSEYN